MRYGEKCANVEQEIAHSRRVPWHAASDPCGPIRGSLHAFSRRGLARGAHSQPPLRGQSRQGSNLVILTMRADFYPKCAANAQLAAAFSDHHVLVGPMSEDELRRAIERPMQRRADATLEALSERERELCRRTFLRPTQPGEGTEDAQVHARKQI
jgi:hypothetical protein